MSWTAPEYDIIRKVSPQPEVKLLTARQLFHLFLIVRLDLFFFFLDFFLKALGLLLRCIVCDEACIVKRVVLLVIELA